MVKALFVKFTGKHIEDLPEGWEFHGFLTDDNKIANIVKAIERDIKLTKDEETKTLTYKIIDLEV